MGRLLPRADRLATPPLVGHPPAAPMLYRWLIRPFLFLFPAETAHHLAFGALRVASAVPGLPAGRAEVQVRL